LSEITLELHLYGALSNYGNSETPGCSSMMVTLPEKSTIRGLLTKLNIPSEERGITFINGDLSALPGLQPDLDHELNDKDRVAFFDLKSMWPFQYRHGAEMIEELTKELCEDEGKGLHHNYSKSPPNLNQNPKPP
jgi:hypothetical protein